MYRWLLGEWRTVGFVALSTVLIYVSTVGAVRASERRTLAEMSVFDFVVAVAIGAIVGRTATTASPSYVQGLVAVFTLAVSHRCLGWVRLRRSALRQIFERRPLIIVRAGRLCPEEVGRGHLSDGDVAAVLREHGVARLEDVQLAVMEANGRFSVIGRDQPELDAFLWPDGDVAPNAVLQTEVEDSHAPR